MTPTPMPCLTTSGPKAVKPAAGQETATVLITQDPPQSDQIDVLLTTPVKGEKKVLLHEHHKRHVEDFKKIFDENMKNKPVKHDKGDYHLSRLYLITSLIYYSFRVYVDMETRTGRLECERRGTNLVQHT
jgi:hypothetical protein